MTDGLKNRTSRRAYYSKGYIGYESSEPLDAYIVSYHSWVDSRSTSGLFRDWRRWITQGDDATTTLQGSKETHVSFPGHVEYLWKSKFAGPTFIYHYKLQGDFLPVPSSFSVAGVSSSDAHNQAIMSFIQKARSVQTKALGLPFLRELSQTLHMIKHPAQALRKGIDDYLGTAKRRVRKSRPSSRAKVLGDTYLEYAFGWKPLVNDINNVVNRLADFDDRELIVVRGSGRVDLPISESVTTGGVGDISWRYRTLQKHVVTVTVRGAVRNLVPNRTLMDPRLLGFDVGSFVPSLWEVLPWSFFIDYFTNIGDVLSAWSFPLSQISWCNQTTRISHEYQVFMFDMKGQFQQSTPDYSYQLLACSPGRAEGSLTTVERVSITGQSLIPDFQVRVPGFGSLKWLNVAALASQRSSFSLS